MYRRTAKYAKRREWHPRQEVAPEDQRPLQWQPPHLRRRITIEDFDGADRLTALGNGQVPRVAARAWLLLSANL